MHALPQATPARSSGRRRVLGTAPRAVDSRLHRDAPVAPGVGAA
ncbi:hypothetical protein [Streptomyces sp. GB4-14]